MIGEFTMPIIRTSESFTWVPTPDDHHQARLNHGQTLTRLKERGGLAWVELANVLLGKPWGYTLDRPGLDYAKAVCRDVLVMRARKDLEKGAPQP